VLRSACWFAEPFGRRGGLLLWPAGVVLGLMAEWRQYGWADPGHWVPDLLTGWTLIGCGLAGWARRPQSRSGLLLAAAGFAWFVPDFATTGVAVLGWLGGHALYLHRGLLGQLVLTYPRGRSRGRVEGAAVAVGYVAAVVTPVWRSLVGTVALAVVLVAVAVRGYVRATGGERRMRRSALQATVLFAAGTATITLVRFAVPGRAADAATLLAYEVMLCALAAGLLVGLVRWPWERAEVADLVVELGEVRSGTLRDELARALGDPSLQVGYWLPDSAAYVDAAGHALAVPEPGSGRSATMVERDGQPLAVLVHDPAVLEDPGLAGAVSSAAGLAAANARLQAEVRSSLAEIAASRRRVLAAADEERSRLEHRLRDGAQRRLDDLAETLRLARRSAGPGAAERITQAELQLTRTQEDLGRLARGLHPRQLSEQGLGAALATLADDFPLPVDLAVPATGISLTVAACVYFICSEALANVAKHASASRVQISVTPRAGGITTEVTDDGVGGADLQGRGIRGLADRVETLGGTLTVTSAPGQGTRVSAVIPDGAGPF
jgi:signal transduction histidine kinase